MKSLNTIFLNVIDAFFSAIEKIVNSLVQFGSIKTKKGQNEEVLKTDNNKIAESQDAQNALKKSLLQLEFISMFETYLEDKPFRNSSLEFLCEFEEIKREAQINTVKYTNKLLCA